MLPNTTRIPSPVVLQAISDVQRTAILSPSAEDLVMSSIVHGPSGEGGKLKLARRKLDSAGYIHSSCGLANDPDRINRLENRLMLASSLAEVSRQAAPAKLAKRSPAAAALIDKAPFAVAKLKGLGGLVSALTMGDICAIAVRYLKTALKAGVKAGVKASLVKQLGNLIAAQPAVSAAIPAAFAPGAAAALAAAPTAAPTTAPAAAAACAAPPAGARRGGRGRGGGGR